MQPISPERRRKHNRMTILVGMVAADGVLLAADERAVKIYENENAMDDVMDIRKIRCHHTRKVAYAAAGDHIPKAVGRELFDQLTGDQFNFRDIESSLEKASIAVIGREAQYYEQPNRSLLIVFYESQNPELWRLDIDARHPNASPVTGLAVAGALGNSARFFGRYFKRDLPVASLEFLAAHMVLMASELDSLMVNGLDIAVFNRNGPLFIDEEKKRTLRKASRELDASIDQQLRNAALR